MEAMINLILQFGDLNKQQIEFLVSKVEMLELKKHDYLSEAGKVPRYVAFVLEGVFRFCYYNNKSEEITNYFVDEGNFVVDNEKFESQIAASEYVQAVTDCKVLVFNKKDWDEISNTIVGWEMMKRSPLVSEDATTRYLSFIKAFPNLINRIPLSYVASYLGVTQQSLSRIRRSIHR
jgi:CRP-like cAMP-binding protein